ncbi:MAG: hypothetical protein AB3N14_14185 [Flavobacteriaceae bacterium]
MGKIASYTFLPWSRKGIASKITEKENFGKPGASDSTERASVAIDIKVKRSSLSGAEDVAISDKKIRLFGPGDIIGIDPKAIIRTEPQDGVTEFEFNYLPYIEFFEEDFAWRYTPASVNDPKAGNPNFDKRLRPWLALLVYKETEIRFEEFMPNVAPLPHFSILADNLFPKDDEYWAWAHVQVNQDLDEGFGDGQSISDRLDITVKAQPNHACSRLLCPRKLEPNTKYHAFLVPAYEKGRLAGRGKEASKIDTVPNQKYSQKNIGSEMPYYYTWSFQTSATGDFEELVRRLEPMPIDPKVGRRPMDISSPGYSLEYDGKEELLADEAFKEQKGAIYLEGALRPPKTPTTNFAKSEEAAAKQMVSELEDILNLDAKIMDEGVPNTIADDPVITPPVYGRWHNATHEVSSSKPNRWINHLNLDPRQRAVAGIGTKVIQQNQQALMDRAWGQFEGIREANRKLREAQFVAGFSANLFHKKISRLSNERLVMETTALHSRFRFTKGTLKKNINQSRLSNAVVTATLRKITRPKGIVKKVGGQKALDKKLLSGSNSGTMQAAVPYDSIKVAADSTVTGLGKALGSIIKNPKMQLTVNPQTFEVSTANTGTGTSTISSPSVIATPIANPIGPIPKIEMTLEKDNILIKPQATLLNQVNLKDLKEKEYLTSQIIFSQYLKKANWTIQKPGNSLNLNSTAKTIKDQLLPENTFTKRVLNRLSFGASFPKPEKEEIAPIYAAPRFDDAMYEPLEKLSSEYLVPNLHLIKNNSISLLETNQEFIESYMVGLNHEFSRELFFQEYLTDRRGYYFRQFWDVSGNPNFKGEDESKFRDALRDIEEIHRWKNGRLGANHPAEQTIKNRLVLVIRGDLLRKYPNTIVYLHQAQFAKPNNPDINIPRKLNAEGEQLFPAFEAKILPDIHFFGFNISIPDARGSLADLDPGYFVVLKERSGEVHFGMDIKLDAEATTAKYKSTQVFRSGIPTSEFQSLLLKPRMTISPGGQKKFNSWSTLSWEEFDNNLEFIDLTKKPKSPTREGVRWGSNAADMAYILYQNPFMMAIHTSKMVTEEMLNA